MRITAGLFGRQHRYVGGSRWHRWYGSHDGPSLVRARIRGPGGNDQDPGKLGVLLGHRRKLRRSITSPKDVETNASAVATASAVHVEAFPRNSAERRTSTWLMRPSNAKTSAVASRLSGRIRVGSTTAPCRSGTLTARLRWGASNQSTSIGRRPTCLSATNLKRLRETDL